MLDKSDLQIFKIASKDETRPTLTGVLFSKVEKDNGWSIRLVATDGYKMTEKTIDVDFEPTFKDMIVPYKTVESVAKLLDRYKKVIISDNQFKIMDTKHIPDGVLERTITIGNTIEGRFPDYKHLMPTEKPVASLSIDVKYMIEALKQSIGDIAFIEMNTINGNLSIVIKNEGYKTKTISLVMPLKSK